jgi:hypothetical protein
MTMLKPALLCSLALAAGNALACYTVYDRGNAVVYHAQTPPVDMSLPIHQTLPAVFPGGHLVFDTSLDCPREQAAAARLPVRSGASPLLTDRSTAEALRLPHSQVAGNVVLVPAQAAARADLPTFSVVPADTAYARAPAVPDTRAMGAGPAPGTVITEMHNPPLTAEQRGKEVRVRH